MAETHNKTANVGLRRADTLVSAGDVLLPPGLNPTILKQLLDATLTFDRSGCDATVAAAIRLGITEIILADQYIPAVARILGDLWVSDHIGFADVTIGSARLQAMLRDLGPDWAADTMTTADAPSVLLLTPQDASHTLGAVVLSGQLRRHGYSVRITFDADRSRIADIMDRIQFNAVFISAAHSESLEKIRRMVEFIRTLTPQHLPIVLGGTVLEASAHVASVTGVDFATLNLDEAIEYCGLISIRNKDETPLVGDKTTNDPSRLAPLK